jgi:uncharacterized protein
MAITQNFQDVQRIFAAHIRDPAHHTAPTDVEDRRMGIYRELFYNNLESFIANAFPVLRKLTPDARWHRMVREFFAHHACRSPYFLQIPQEFLIYLQTERASDPDDPPFLQELAHYEWMELAASAHHEIAPEHDPAGDLLQGVPALAPWAWVLGYHFPVHRIGPEYQPHTPSATPTWLLIYRAPNFEVKFMELNSVTAEAVRRIQHNTAHQTGKALFTHLALALGYADPATLHFHGHSLLNDLKQRGAILGTYR